MAEGQIDPDPVPDDSSRRWGISAIVRPSKGIAAILANVATQISQFVGPAQVIYDETNLHLTIRSIEFYRSRVPREDKRVAEYAQILGKIARQFSPLRIHFAGLTADRGGVLAQGWPLGDDLQHFRETLQASLRAAGILTGPESEAVRQTAHTSLVVFSTLLADSQGLVNFVERNRATDYGISETSLLELVRYRRTPTSVEPVSLASIRCGPL